MLVSVWVKEGDTSCKCSSYLGNEIQISFPEAAGSSVDRLFPSGNIIEGWQRYEGVFTVPRNVGKFTFQLKMKNTGGSNNDIYFDDIRIHPYHANMKSFVYHPLQPQAHG